MTSLFPRAVPRQTRRPLSLILCLALLACSAQPRIYSRSPVDRDGDPIPVSSATKIVFEDGTNYELTDQESLSIRKDSVRVSGSTYGTAVWSLAQVEGIEWRDDEGHLHWSDVRTPEDLRSFVSLPPIDRVTLDDGTEYRLEGDRFEARLDPTGLFLMLAEDEDWEGAERLELAHVASIELHEPNLAGATVKSPVFWVATVAAAIAIYLVTGDGDPDRTAVR